MLTVDIRRIPATTGGRVKCGMRIFKRPDLVSEYNYELCAAEKTT